MDFLDRARAIKTKLADKMGPCADLLWGHRLSKASFVFDVAGFFAGRCACVSVPPRMDKRIMVLSRSSVALLDQLITVSFSVEFEGSLEVAVF